MKIAVCIIIYTFTKKINKSEGSVTSILEKLLLFLEF